MRTHTTHEEAQKEDEIVAGLTEVQLGPKKRAEKMMADHRMKEATEEEIAEGLTWSTTETIH